jgi:hypothetical protein
MNIRLPSQESYDVQHPHIPRIHGASGCSLASVAPHSELCVRCSFGICWRWRWRSTFIGCSLVLVFAFVWCSLALVFDVRWSSLALELCVRCSGPRSDTISVGSPCLNTWSKYKCAVSSAVTLVMVGQKCAILVNRSTQT